MQSQDVISVNFWQIFISLCNLLLLCFILKKFLYKPVLRVIKEREEEIFKKYDEAEKAETAAKKHLENRENQIKTAREKSDEILNNSLIRSRLERDKIIADAKKDADLIISQAKSEANSEYQKAHQKIKDEIVDISVLLTEKMLKRELKENDHQKIIEDTIFEIGDIYDETS